ncbi:MAG: hypothetical protein WBZ29_17945 [Methanocella sp.]
MLIGAMLVAMMTPAYAAERNVGNVATQVNNGFSVALNSGSSGTYDMSMFDYANWNNEMTNNDNTDSYVCVGVKAYFDGGGVLYTFQQIGRGQTFSGDNYKSRVMVDENPSNDNLEKLHYYDSQVYVFNGGHYNGVTDTIN